MMSNRNHEMTKCCFHLVLAKLRVQFYSDHWEDSKL